MPRSLTKVTCEYCGTELEVKTIEEMYAAKEVAAAKAQAAKEAKWDTSAAGSEWEADEAEQMKRLPAPAAVRRL